jgi:D-alanyl-D-alanine carboxypeptidase/D-alanyl-D-alanine-endopeptidase (penicillin-binding protein 4)
VVTLNGAFPRDCTVRTRLQLLDRAELTERLFRSLWLGLGGSWAGTALEATEPPDTAGSRVLARRDGRPWGELLRHVNKTSDNAWSRVLYLELGVPAMAAEPARRTQELADAAVRRWLAQHGIDDTGLVMDNGSGLSRSERISAWQLAQLLKVAHNGPHASELLMGLSIAGVDGALRNRLKEGPAAGWVRLKTGGLRNVVSVAGYVNDPQGRPWAVVAMVNHDTLSSKGRPALDALVDHIARFGVPAVPAMPGPQGDGP